MRNKIGLSDEIEKYYSFFRFNNLIKKLNENSSEIDIFIAYWEATNICMKACHYDIHNGTFDIVLNDENSDFLALFEFNIKEICFSLYDQDNNKQYKMINGNLELIIAKSSEIKEKIIFINNFFRNTFSQKDIEEIYVNLNSSYMRLLQPKKFGLKYN